MKNTRLAAVAVPALAMAFSFATACTNEPGAVLPEGSGTIVGGTGYGGGSGGSTGSTNGGSGGGTTSPPADAGLSNTPPPGTGDDDANAPRPDPEAGAGSGGQHDSGSGSGGYGFGVDGQVPVIDSGSGTSGPLGSCTNPACGSDGNECGCQATDSNGNNVQLGCEAGGLCACFVNGNQVTDAFNENGVCSETPQDEAQMFLQYCGGNCN